MKKPEPSLPTPAGLEPTTEEIQNLIRQGAYVLIEQRGRKDGRDFDDWIAAQFEVVEKSAEQR